MLHGFKQWPALCYLEAVLCSRTLISCPVVIACSLWHALCVCLAHNPFQVSSAGGRQVVACSVDSVYDHLAWIHTPKEKNGLGECCM